MLLQKTLMLSAIYRITTSTCNHCCHAAFSSPTQTIASKIARPVAAFSLGKELPHQGYNTISSSRRVFVLMPFTKLSGSNGDNAETKDDEPTVEPTWTYTPYKPPPKKRNGPRRNNNGPRRNFSSRSNDDNWVVPNKLTIPEDKIEMSFERSSGAGGQNVNKVETKVIIKVHVMQAGWIPKEVRERIVQNEGNKINKDGYLQVSSQEYRTQAQNRKDAVDKLQEIILKHYPRPKVRKLRKGVSRKAKERNKEQKRNRSEVKKNRGRVDLS